MNKYENGKIYKIVDDTNDNIYIGSTYQKYLSRRLQGHLTNYKRYIEGKRERNITSFKIFENSSYHIELIEKYPCKNRMELEKRERYYIESLECVNKVIPGRTPKEYREANKDKIKKYYEKNKDKINEQQKKIMKRIKI